KMKHRLLALAIVACCASMALPVHADDASLKSEVEALRAEVAALKAEVQQMHVAQPAALMPAPAAAPNPGVAVASADAPAAPHPGRSMTDAATANATSLWGYGQIDYNHPTARAADARADLTRAVIGFDHSFNETTRVYGELEWEHAIASADDAGESEVEQLFIEHALSPNYGEQAIIPSTWREGGVAGYGTTDSGFQWDVGLVTSPNLGKWDPTSPDGR